MAPSIKKDDSLPDTLKRVSALGLTDQQVHERAHLPSGWLSQFRNGRYGPKAASRKRFERWLARFEAGEDAREGAREELADRIDVDAVLPPEATPVAREIAEAAGKAKTFRRCGRLLQRITELTALGAIDPELAETLEKLISRRVQVLKLERGERAAAAIRSLEILTADEAELLRAHRERLAGEPLKSGEAVAPPPEIGVRA